MSIGVEHDADGLALVGRASRRRTGGGRSQQLGQERIFLAYRLVGHHGDLTVARRGHQGDDPAPLEETEDALAGALDDGLDVLLGKSRRRVEDGRTAVAPRGVRSIELENVIVRGEPQIAVGALDHGDGAAFAVRDAPLRHALAVVGRHGVGEDAQDLAQQFPVESQRKTQRKGHGQHELSDGHFG